MKITEHRFRIFLAAVFVPLSLIFITMIISIKPWLELADQSDLKQPLMRVGESFSGLALSSDAESDEFRMNFRSYGPFASGEGFDPNERMEFYHQPIMSAEILAAMAPVRGKQIFDGTLGGGGHSELLLSEGAHVIGCDQDGDALLHAKQRLQTYGDQFLTVRGNFELIGSLLTQVGVEKVDGILLDLGVSSKQLDNPDRGFSFRFDGPLDMRMDDRAEFSARDLVNDWSVEEMTRIFREYGEERHSFRAAKAIVKAREQGAINRTSELVDIISRVIPKVSKRNPATRVFQAIRIAVNRELEVLENALENSLDHLAEGGVLSIITFHSLEDRIVKHFMRRRSTPFLDRPEWTERRENPEYCLQLPQRRAIIPTKEEVESNPRARSAKLRVAIKL